MASVNENGKNFRITKCRGFHITFPNGVTLSTQFGYINYCENRYNEEYDDKNIIKFITEHKALTDVESDTVEVGIWDKNGEWITKKMAKEVFDKDIDDDVMGWVTIDKWIKIFDWCKNYRR